MVAIDWSIVRCFYDSEESSANRKSAFYCRLNMFSSALSSRALKMG